MGYRPAVRTRHRVADAVVVLGARLTPEGRPTLSLRRRVELGIALHRAGAAPLLLLTGGGERGRPEALAMAEAARAAGVPEAALLVEPRSANTFENAVESAALLRARGLRRVLLVSERYHLFRARLLFRQVGLEVVDAVSPPAAWHQDWRMWLREGVALPRSLWRSARRQRS